MMSDRSSVGNWTAARTAAEREMREIIVYFDNEQDNRNATHMLII